MRGARACTELISIIFKWQLVVRSVGIVPLAFWLGSFKGAVNMCSFKQGCQHKLDSTTNVVEKCPSHTKLNPLCILLVKQYNLIAVFLNSINDRAASYDSPWHKIVACPECF